MYKRKFKDMTKYIKKFGFTRTPKFGVSLLGKRGFTLIELLVVIAIIGLLSSIVVRYVEEAKSKGENSSIKSDLHSASSQINISYSINNDSFANLCTTDAKLIAIMRDASLRGSGSATSYVCNSTVTVWAISSPLKVSESGKGYWCVDSTGNAKSELSNLSAGVYQCP